MGASAGDPAGPAAALRSKVVVLAGGVGGARLAHGFQSLVGSDLTVIVNTGDDLVRHGLQVCPDHDTVLYNLAGIDDRQQGWGIRDETWAASAQLAAYGEDTWFRLGDRDLATHVLRTERLRLGRRPTEVALELRSALGVAARILPMTDEPVRTQVLADGGWLEFQEYFVHQRQAPEVREVRFHGIEDAEPTAEIREALASADFVAIAPSNPIVSIGPILAVPGFHDLLAAVRSRGVPVVAVSGIIGGRAVRGPADRMLASLGHESSALGVARLYAGMADGFVMDVLDGSLVGSVEALGLAVAAMDTLMTDDAARSRVAAAVLDLGARVRSARAADRIR